MAVLLTSGYNFEGYKIKKYMGFCSGECVLGTGFFSALNAGVADFLGSNSSMYEEKLSKAKLAAIKELQNHVKKVTAPYKYPRVIEFVEELPKTISGKIRRVEIRQNDEK